MLGFSYNFSLHEPKGLQAMSETKMTHYFESASHGIPRTECVALQENRVEGKNFRSEVLSVTVRSASGEESDVYPPILHELFPGSPEAVAIRDRLSEDSNRRYAAWLAGN